MEVIPMAYTADILDSLVPITQFNRGQASRIFDRLHTENQLIVLKNNQPAAIILSPSEFQRLNIQGTAHDLQSSYRLPSFLYSFLQIIF